MFHLLAVTTLGGQGAFGVLMVQTHMHSHVASRVADTENMCSLVCGSLLRVHRYTGTGVHRVFTSAAIRGPSMGDLGKCMEYQEEQTPQLLIWNNFQDVLLSKEHCRRV